MKTLCTGCGKPGSHNTGEEHWLDKQIACPVWGKTYYTVYCGVYRPARDVSSRFENQSQTIGGK